MLADAMNVVHSLTNLLSELASRARPHEPASVFVLDSIISFNRVGSTVTGV